jgi:hypothetical protein
MEGEPRGKVVVDILFFERKLEERLDRPKYFAAVASPRRGKLFSSAMRSICGNASPAILGPPARGSLDSVSRNSRM